MWVLIMELASRHHLAPIFLGLFVDFWKMCTLKNDYDYIKNV